MSTTTKKHLIKALKNFRKMAAEVVVPTSQSIQAHFDNNPNLNGAPPLPVTMATLKADTEQLQVKITAAAEGGKTAVAQKNHMKQVVAGHLIQLAQYAEANCKDDMTIFLSMGFTPAATTKKKTPPLSGSIHKIEPGDHSGEVKLTLVSNPDAVSYVVQYAQLGAGGAPGPFTSKPAAGVKPPLLITGLTPGATYLFEARALTKNGYTDWSGSVTRIAL